MKNNMNLKDTFELNYDLQPENRFTRKQWENIINNAFSVDNSFNRAVDYFYSDLLEFDFEISIDLITDIQNGNGNAFDRFIDDIMNFYKYKN